MNPKNVVSGLALATVFLGGVGSAIAANAPEQEVNPGSHQIAAALFPPPAGHNWTLPHSVVGYHNCATDGCSKTTLAAGTTVLVIGYYDDSDNDLDYVLVRHAGAEYAVYYND